jgi:predicted dehydrogenase/threonine dehydrogenase-like Zn-dependent dehydrogenase
VKQVVQNYRTGELLVDDVPIPAARAGGLLIRTRASVVSAGTEKSKVDLARKTLVGKAMARPDQVRKVLDTLKKEGVVNTYNKVKNKLDSLSPLGYSAAGTVVAVGEGCAGFSVGDRVACAGAGYANHAEVNWVPVNLCTPIPDGVAFEQAAFATIGAIALQGVRQAEAAFGELIVVIGLGLIGQLTVQLLRAAGCQVVGVDLDPAKVERARASGANQALLRSDDVAGHVHGLSQGRGADAVIITAAAPSNDPFILAGDIARDRAKVVLVGAVPIEVPRSPYYEKELDVRLSRSYGPGRYDPGYEEGGIDYPAGYVRWTENRNMAAFLAAISAGQLPIDSLITHRVPLIEAGRAYDLISGKLAEPFLGVVLTYPSGDDTADNRPIPTPAVARHAGKVRIAFIGAGSFAGGTLIPALKAMPEVTLGVVCTASGLTARDTAIRHRFEYSVSDPDQILDDDDIGAVFIATRHDSHADLAARALARGKAVFVEKPLALTTGDLDRVMTAARENPALMVGFNRRFSPYTRKVQQALAATSGARVIHIRVNAGPIDPDSWIHDPAVGGGRLLGEACHFVDLALALAGARPIRVAAAALGQPDPDARLRDNAAITVEFDDGAIASILYTSKGDMALGKERVEVFAGGTSAVIDDFQSATIVRGGKTDRTKGKQDKGHTAELTRFIHMLTRGTPSPIDLDQLRASTLATLAIVESLAVGAPVGL